MWQSTMQTKLIKMKKSHTNSERRTMRVWTVEALMLPAYNSNSIQQARHAYYDVIWLERVKSLNAHYKQITLRVLHCEQCLSEAVSSRAAGCGGDQSIA